MTAEVEVAELAEQLTAGTCARQVVQHTQLMIHTDNGSPMIAKTVVILLAGVVGIALAWCRRDRLLGALLLAPVAAWLIKTMVYYGSAWLTAAVRPWSPSSRRSPSSTCGKVRACERATVRRLDMPSQLSARWDLQTAAVTDRPEARIPVWIQNRIKAAATRVLFLPILCLTLALAGGAAAAASIDPFIELPLGDGGPTSPSRLGEAVPSVTWVKHAGNPVLDVGPAGSWDHAAVGLPSLLAAGGSYLMWYTGAITATSSLRIGLATSSDGLGWKKAPGNPGLDVGSPGSWDSGGVTAPDVIYYDGLYRMWYRGTNDLHTYMGGAFGYATSPDGLQWTPYAANPVLTVGAADAWDGAMLWSASVLAEADGYKMWYSAYNAIWDGKSWTYYGRIGYATSQDGVSWTKYAGNPVLELGPAGAWDDRTVYYPNVIRTGGTYEMWYTGLHGGKGQIGHATSADGIVWAKDPANPVVPPGPAGSWDSQAVLASPVIVQPGSIRMWYTGLDKPDSAGGVYRIGAAAVGIRAYLPLIRR